jgi:hypothetical protein
MAVTGTIKSGLIDEYGNVKFVIDYSDGTTHFDVEVTSDIGGEPADLPAKWAAAIKAQTPTLEVLTRRTAAASYTQDGQVNPLEQFYGAAVDVTAEATATVADAGVVVDP